MKPAYEVVTNSNPGAPKAKEEENFKALLAWCQAEKKTAEAAQLLELKKDYLAAAEKFKECLLPARAAECLEKLGRQGEAGELYRQSGDLEKAADRFKQAGQWKNAASCLEQIKKWAEAKIMYQRSHDQDGVSRCNSALRWL